MTEEHYWSLSWIRRQVLGKGRVLELQAIIN